MRGCCLGIPTWWNCFNSKDDLSNSDGGVRQMNWNCPKGSTIPRSHKMTKYLISFNDGAMTFPEEELPDVAKAARAVVQEAKDAGVFGFAGGLGSPWEASVVATDGAVTDGPNSETKDFIGGFTVVDVP